MKALLKYGLCAALGLAAARSFAQEVQWRPASSQPGGGVSLSRPVPLGQPAPLASLARPTPFARGQSPEEKPLPPGPALLPGGKSEARPIPPVPPRPIPLTPETARDKEPAEQIPAPKVKDAAPPASSLWGGPIPPGMTATAPAPAADCGNPCPDVCCETSCGSGRCRPLGLLHCLWGKIRHHDACGTTSCLPSGCLTSSCPTGPCATGGCLPSGCFDECCPSRPHVWVFGEYLLWFAREQNVPPLVTVSPAGTPRELAGVLGRPGTLTAFDSIDENPRSGGRFGLGFWFSRNSCWGMDASFFILAPRTGDFVAASAGDPIIARPIFNGITGNPEAELVAFPGVLAGSVAVHHESRIWGLEVNLRRKLHCGPNYWLDGLIGYRHFDLDEEVSITENLTVPDPATGQPFGTILVSDRFRTHNRFDGPQVGLAGEKRLGQRWFVAGTAKVAMGVMHQRVDIGGNTAFNFPAAGINTVQTGGLLALPTNIGRHTSDRFAVIPELGVKLGVDLTDHLRLYAGYDFMYISSVVRPAEQIDLVVNRSQIPNAFGPQPLVGAARPAVLFQTNDFWLQGVNFGLQYHW